MLCNVHIRSHPLNDNQEQITLSNEENSDFTVWMGRTWSPLCCHGNVTVDMELCDEYKNCRKFQFYAEKDSRGIPFVVILHHFVRTFNVTSPLICINKNLNNWATKNAINKINAILHHFESSFELADKNVVSYTL